MNFIVLVFFCSVLFHTYSFPNHGSKIETQWPTLDGKPPVLLGHGGDKFYLPEHSTGAYKISAIGGADYVEPDVVLSKDQVPICFHDLALKKSTDIAEKPEFAARRGNHTVIIDGKTQIIYDDWLVIHFTVDELKTLRIQQQPNGVRLQDFNELYPLTTFQEYLDTIHEMSFKLGKPIGIIPEIKHPLFHNTVFNIVDHFMENIILSMLRSNGYPILAQDSANCTHGANPITCGPVILQCFDKNTTQYLSTVVSSPNVELMTLVHPDVYSLTPIGFAEIANFSDYICLMKEYMYTGVEAEIAYKGWEYDQDLVDLLGGFMEPHQFVPEAHRMGTKIALFTIPDSRESSGRGCAIQCDPVNKLEEMFYFFGLGVDGLFVENLPESVRMRMQYDYELQLNATRFPKNGIKTYYVDKLTK